MDNTSLKEEAKRIGTELGLEGFNGSDGFLTRWKRRNNVAIRRGTNESQKIPEDHAEKLADFRQLIWNKRHDHEYTMANIANLDETMCRFDMAPSSTNNVRGERTVRIATTGGAKKGFTVLLAACANGTKLPAFCVFKEGKKAVIPPRVLAALRVPGNVRVAASQNGWMTKQLMCTWVNRVWHPNQDDVRRLLVLDQARVHTAQDVKDKFQEVDTDLIFVPAGCTPLVQPADVSWNTPFKLEMRKQWTRWRKGDLRTPQGNLKMATRYLFSTIIKSSTM